MKKTLRIILSIMFLAMGAVIIGFSVLLIHEGQIIFTWLPLISLGIALIAVGLWISLGAKPKDIIDTFFG